ncbi:MAG: type I 3-dehydroquinate dehydratase [Agathobacter sp.]|nr:type I 3-dehydroquinate dehydratase [Agathobacter sp.]
MKEYLCVKNKVIGSGRPLVCVPVLEKNKEDILNKVKEMVKSHVEMIEWRVDAFGHANDLNAVRDVLEQLKPLVTDTILVYTYRSKNQGGMGELSQDEIYDLHEIAAEEQIVDFIDVEFMEAKNAPKEIRKLQEKGTYVIASHHDFGQTPRADILEMILERMHGSDAAIVKLAVMPNDVGDVLTLLQETYRFHARYPETPIITMSMGSLGCLSRVAGELVGSCVTFGAFDKASAPGQLPVEELDTVLRILHDRMKGE